MELRTPETEAEYKNVITEDGSVKLVKTSDIKRGKKSKAKGGTFEAKVRKDLEKKDWIVDKWTNNIDLDTGKVSPSKRKYNPFSKVMAIGTGFPDFIAFQKMENNHKVIGVEVKTNGTLNKIEKKKCRLYLDKEIFSEILIAKKKKVKNRVSIEYIEFSEIEKRMRK